MLGGLGEATLVRTHFIPHVRNTIVKMFTDI